MRSMDDRVVAKRKYPYEYSFPTELTFKADDGDGNIRDVKYIRADAHICIRGTLERLEGCYTKEPQLDFGKGDNNAQI